MDGIGIKNLQQSLKNYVRPTRDEGIINAGATNISIPVAFKTWIVNQHVGYYVQVFSGGSLSFEWSLITANTTNTLTIFPALSFAPIPGDTIAILDISTPGGPGVAADITEWGSVPLTGADITPNIQNLDLTITALRNAIAGVGVAARTLGQIEAAIIAVEPRNISQWGGTALTGADITINLANLDLAITALRDAIAGAGAAARTLGQIEAAIIATEPRNISQWGGTALTGADITINLANLDLATTDLRDAIAGAGAAARTLGQIEAAIIATEPRNISQWGGTALTGRDITGDIDNLQNLDLATTALRDAIAGAGAAARTLGDLDSDIVGTNAGETITLANGIDISGAGVASALSNYQNWSLYLNAAAAMNITVELSPDAGTHYYFIAESPITFAAAGDEVYEIGYTANRIRLIGSNATLVHAQVRGKF